VKRVLLVHGIAQQYRGPQSMHAECAPALCDGVNFAGGSLAVDEVDVAFYGDLFRPPGVRSLGMPDYDPTDLHEQFELDLLSAWYDEVSRAEPAARGPEISSRVRTPNWVQRALYALSGSSFFAGMTERAMIGALKQVQAYFTDDEIRARIQQRILDAVTTQTSVVVGHSLGTIVAYEVLCAEPGTLITTLVTLGSPLGIPRLIFDRLRPAPTDGVGVWPLGLKRWTNIADSGDIVALTKRLAPLFGPGVSDVLIHNGVKAHDIHPYLTAGETGAAIVAGLAPDQ
jgi:hypothetical protein